MADSESMSPTRTVLILLSCLIVLIVLLVFLYKKLNREADGEYTIRRMVYKEGGVRDRVRSVALALGSHLGVRLWPRSDADEDGEELQEIQDEEAKAMEGNSHGSDSKDDDQEEEDNVGQCYKTKGEGGDSSDDNSSLESSEAEEFIKPTHQPEANREMKKKGEEREEKGGDEEGDASGGPEFLIDLKQFSGSVIWSEEEGVTCDVTPL